MRQTAVFFLIFVMILLCAFNGCGKDEGEKGGGDVARSGGSSDGDPLSLFFKSIKAYNDQDMSALIQMFDPMLQWKNRTAAQLEIRGRAGLANLFMQEKNMFPDREIKLRRVVVQGSDIVAQVVARATHRGSAHGIKPTGKKVSWDFGYFTTIDKGKIKRTEVYFNPVATLRQMGAVSGSDAPVPTWPEQTETIRGKQNGDNENRVKTFYALLGSKSLDRLGEFVTEKSVFNDRGMIKSYKGFEEIKEYFEKIRTDFENVSFEVERVISAGSFVAAQVIMRGVCEMKPERSDKAENKEVELNELHVFRVNEGKIDDLDFYFDELQVYKQFGYSLAGAAVILSDGKKASPDAGLQESKDAPKKAESVTDKKEPEKKASAEVPQGKKVGSKNDSSDKEESPF